MSGKTRTEISELGEFGLIEKLTSRFTARNASTATGPGDDAAVIAPCGVDGPVVVLSTDMMSEGVDFDLTYFPLKHLGYKAVVVGCSDICAMNAVPRQIMLSLGVSAKLCVEHLDEFYDGVKAACDEYGIDLAGGDTSSSVNGFTIGITAAGEAPREKIAYRGGAQANDLVCITGDLGAAYMGLHLLEREKRALAGHPSPKPRFAGYEYLLQRQLRPALRVDVVRWLDEAGIVPTSMIDLSDGLASDMLHICRRSGCGVRIYLERLPIARDTHRMAGELQADPVVAALNGGDDHELLFTVPLSMRDRVVAMGGIEIIGHITEAARGAVLVTPDGAESPLTAQGWVRSGS